MRRIVTRRSLGWTAVFLGLAVGLVIASHVWSGSQASPDDTQARPDDVSTSEPVAAQGFMAHRDEHGAWVHRPQEPRPAEAQRGAAPAIEQRVGPGGAVIAVLPEEYMEYTVATIDENGQLHIHCVSDPRTILPPEALPPGFADLPSEEDSLPSN